MNYLNKFIVLIGLLITISACQVQKQNKDQAEKGKYNVLFVPIDDLNDYISILEDYPGLKTPNLDKFAKKAINFTSAYCAAPVCNPSRTAIISGIIPVKSGIYENNDLFENSASVMNAELLPELFKSNGYKTMWSGKLFHTRPGEERMNAMWDDMRGHDGGYGPWPDKKIAKDISRFFNYKSWEGPDSDFPDVRNADITIERLQQEHDKPFFMVYGLYRPHNPWTAPKRFYDMYPLDEIQLPEVPEDDLDDLPEIAREWAAHPVKLDRIKELKEWKPVLRSYLASISFMDYNLGRVLDALEKSEYRDNTIVILWADHGFHMGEKEHFAKYALWEQTTHTLLMAKIPGMKGGQQREQPVNLIDLYPTLIDYCDLTTPKQPLDGESLRNVIEDPSYTRTKPSITYFKKGSVGMRTKDWRYIRYYDGTEELYDRQKDPKEWKNLANDPAFDQVKKDFQKWLPKEVKKAVGK